MENIIQLNLLVVQEKQKKMHSSKKAQISDTMSWIVATIIIFLILLIPLSLVSTGIIGTNKIYFERTQDALATKSLSGYLLKGYSSLISDAEKGQVSPENEKKLGVILSSLSRHNKTEGWNMEIISSDRSLYKKISYSLLSFNSKKFETPFYFLPQNKEFTLKFWMEGQ